MVVDRVVAGARRAGAGAKHVKVQACESRDTHLCEGSRESGGSTAILVLNHKGRFLPNLGEVRDLGESEKGMEVKTGEAREGTSVREIAFRPVMRGPWCMVFAASKLEVVEPRVRQALTGANGEHWGRMIFIPMPLPLPPATHSRQGWHVKAATLLPPGPLAPWTSPVPPPIARDYQADLQAVFSEGERGPRPAPRSCPQL